MKSSTPSITVLLSADAGAVTRELRITRKAVTMSLLLGAIAIGLCGWAGWQLGHWSAKEGARATHVGSTELVAALDAHEVSVAP